MRRFKLGLAVAFAGMWIVSSGLAQTSNLPATYLENFELQTNTILVRGHSLVGSFSIGANTLSVDANEVNDITHSQKAYGIKVEYNGGPGTPQTGLIVDYDELDSLSASIDYLSKVTWGVTQLNGFEAAYTTKSGLHIIAHSDRRDAVVNTYVQFGDAPRIQASADQLTQLRNLIIQAKSTLDSLK